MKTEEKVIRNTKWLVFLTICIVVLVATISVLCYKSHQVNSEYHIPYEKESELKYWEVKSQLTDECQRYIHQVAPYSALRAFELVDLCELYSVDLRFVLAQGHLESHFGTRGLAAKTNSIWNLGAFDGLKVNKINGKYKYSHPNQSIEPYLKLLSSRYLVDRCELDLLQSFTDTNGSRYATDEHYEERLTAKYQHIDKVTKIDSLQSLLRYYTVMSNR